MDFIDTAIELAPFMTVSFESDEAFVSLKFMGNDASEKAWKLHNAICADVEKRKKT